METNVGFRQEKPTYNNSDIVTVHKLHYIFPVKGSAFRKSKTFLTIDAAEIGIKAVEVLQENESVDLMYVRVKTTFGQFKEELQGLIY